MGKPDSLGQMRTRLDLDAGVADTRIESGRKLLICEF
jgi:hypothetical protein